MWRQAYQTLWGPVRASVRKWRARRIRRWDHRELGRQGERLAARHLRQQGVTVVARGQRDRLGEIDLIGVDRQRTLIFVEVKTRRDTGRGDPGQAVNASKQRRILRAAERFLHHRKLQNHPVRYDVIAVHWPPNGDTPRLRHFPAAFEAPDEGNFP